MAKRAGAAGGAVRITNKLELEVWLQDWSRAVAIAIAARAALRVAPFAANTIAPQRDGPRHRDFLSLTSAIFRATAIGRVAGMYPTRPVDGAAEAVAFAAREIRAGIAGLAGAVPDPRHAFAGGDPAVAANIACVAAFAATEAVDLEAVYPARAARAANFAAIAAYGIAASDAIWVSVSRDTGLIADGLSAAGLAGQPLWLGEAPSWAQESWTKLEAALPKDQDWEVWTRWYRDILDGVAHDEAYELTFAGWDGEAFIDIWKDGPAAANKWIREHLPRTDKSTLSWDFFISYNEHDESSAREITGVLESVGHRVFAQFKDIAAGKNFVREMQAGLTRSARLIALYSPDYETSDHGQAEWSAAYNADPSGSSRKLIPFMIRDTALNDLARQIVYVNLVGLSEDKRRQAVLAATADFRLPSQNSIGSQFKRGAQGKIDIALDPPSSTTEREVEQRETYDAMRFLAQDLLAQGPNVLGSLEAPARRLMEALPEQQNDASTRKIFFIGNFFRQILAAHGVAEAKRKASKEPEIYGDPDELPAGVAARVRAFVPAFNNFVKGDAIAQKLNALGMTAEDRAPLRDALTDIAPVVEETPRSVMTETARENLEGQIEAGQKAPDSDLGDKDRAIAGKSALNWVLEMLRSGAGAVLSGAAGATGKKLLEDNWVEVVEFVQRYADEITSFAKKTVSDPEELKRILDRIREILS